MNDESQGHSVRLPSGLVARLQRPDPSWWDSYPTEIALARKAEADGCGWDDPRLNRFAVEILREAFVGSKPPLLDLEDAVYVFKWIADKTPPDGCAPQRLM